MNFQVKTGFQLLSTDEKAEENNTNSEPIIRPIISVSQ